jgi:hypothetical protein
MPESKTPTEPVVEAPCAICTGHQSDRDNNVETSITKWWHCGACDAHLDRYRGSGDQTCQCGAEYNAFGQRLRSDWRSNASNYDDEVDDMTGFEVSQLGYENAR